MARRVDRFEKNVQGVPRRYPWEQWCDSSIWEIRQGEDYDVPTENMRVNLHERARQRVMKVRTEKFSDRQGEGLRFCFTAPEIVSPIKGLRKPLGHGNPTARRF
jgi:hypothetical protein